MSNKKSNFFIAKITTNEKIVITVALVLSLFIGTQRFLCQKKIKEADGVKHLIIETGKEINDIKKQIEDEK